MKLLQSTFTALLEVTLDDRHRLENVRVLDSGRGVYFGLSRDDSTVYCVARNTDVNGKVVDPAKAVSAILNLDDGSAKSVPDTRGIHQIRCRDGLIWIMNCRDPELVAIDPHRGEVIGTLSLASFVPAELQHGFPTEHPLDRYHFNSLFFTENRLVTLAHNWGFGSFALEFEFENVDSFLASPHLLRTHTGLGHQSHDVFVEGDRLHVLDSANARLLISQNCEVRTTPAGQHGFARGLAANDEFFWIGHGSIAKREDRVHGPTHISVLDRKTLSLVSTVEVGPFGNPCDLLLLSERDQTD